MIVRMSRDPERRWDELLMQRYLPVHWRFQELLGYPEDRSLDGIHQWCVAVQSAIREILGHDHERSQDMMQVRSRLFQAQGIVGWRREQKMRREVGHLRAQTFGILCLAAEEEAEDRMAMRVVALHPWIAEPAAPRFNSDRHAAVSMAASNLETKWRERLGVDQMSFGFLAESFDPKKTPTASHPALRLHGYTKGTADFESAHKGAELMAKGCVKGIRNLHAHRADVPISPGYALEMLGSLSLIARWVATAEVVPPKQGS
ncbi:MAG: hypothetical protein OXC98_08280 [bacterium]|nr:hypothetical protein [bacterium]